MEETVGNLEGARTVFARWMKWKPDTNAWLSYIKLESRCGGSRDQKLTRCRSIYERFLGCHQDLDSYMRYAKWEQRNADVCCCSVCCVP
jgi:crooked neck